MSSVPHKTQDQFKNELIQIVKSTDKKQRIQQLKDDVLGVVKTMKPRSSMFTRASIFWQQQTLWYKLSWIVLLIAPVLTFGFLVHFVPFITIGLFAAVFFPFTWFLLSNHHSLLNTGDDLDNAISGTVDYLGNSLDDLDADCERCTTELNDYESENNLLDAKVQLLTGKINELQKQIDSLQLTSDALRVEVTGLEGVTAEFDLKIASQEKALEASQSELGTLEKSHLENEKQLAAAINSSLQKNAELETKLKSVIVVQESFKTTVMSVSENAILDEDARMTLKSKVDALLSTIEESYLAIANKLQQKNKELLEVRQEIAANNERNKQLLEQLAVQLGAGEQQIGKTDKVLNSDDLKDLTEILEQIGLFKQSDSPNNVSHSDKTALAFNI